LLGQFREDKTLKICEDELARRNKLSYKEKLEEELARTYLKLSPFVDKNEEETIKNKFKILTGEDFDEVKSSCISFPNDLSSNPDYLKYDINTEELRNYIYEFYIPIPRNKDIRSWMEERLNLHLKLFKPDPVQLKRKAKRFERLLKLE
jgi:hypothetical protein